MKTKSIRTPELEKLVGVTEARLRQIAAGGHIPAPDDGNWQHPQTLQMLFKFYRSKNETTRLDEAKLRKAEAEATIAEMEVARATKRLVPAENVNRHLDAIAGAVKSGILNSGLSPDDQRGLLRELQRLLSEIPDEIEPQPSIKP